VHKSFYYKSDIDEFTTVLTHTGESKKGLCTFYATLHSLMLGQ